ncbi:MAG: hypothetical protein E7436_00940 [Ruminococcaceae bacterium]|nr:hypothetical protein [Oscillospiraceae bacterium]
MKKIVALFLAMVITAALWAGGTAAYASIYTVTTPDITVDFDGGTEVYKDLSAPNDLWEPGFSTYTNIRIDGDADFNWKLSMADGDSTLILPEVIDVYWAYTEDIKGMTRAAALGNMKYVGTLADFLRSENPLTISDTCKEGSHTITVALKMRESAGNDYKNATAQFRFTVTVSGTASGTVSGN